MFPFLYSCGGNERDEGKVWSCNLQGVFIQTKQWWKAFKNIFVQPTQRKANFIQGLLFLEFETYLQAIDDDVMNLAEPLLFWWDGYLSCVLHTANYWNGMSIQWIRNYLRLSVVHVFLLPYGWHLLVQMHDGFQKDVQWIEDSYGWSHQCGPFPPHYHCCDFWWNLWTVFSQESLLRLFTTQKMICIPTCRLPGLTMS